MTTSVVVLSVRPGTWLEPCLASVVPQADEVLLVDNGSPGAEASEIGRRLGAAVLRSPTNLGYAAGVNLGIRHARGDLVALLNDDAVAGPGWLAAAEAVLEAPDVAAVTPKILRAGWYREVLLPDPPHPAPGDPRPLARVLRSVTVAGEEVLDRLLGPGIHALEGAPGGSWRWSAPGRPFYVPVPGPDAAGEVRLDGEPAPPGPVCRLLNKAGGYLRGDGVLGDHGDESPDDGRWEAAAERFYASGTALVTRADTLARVGPLAAPFFAYYEDGDWSWRARLAGLRLCYDPVATVEHRHSATSGGAASALVRRLAERNRLLCLTRNAPPAVVAAAWRRWGGTGPREAPRRDSAARLAWALASRRSLARRWVLSPGEVWSRWADVDVSWDDAPARGA